MPKLFYRWYEFDKQLLDHPYLFRCAVFKCGELVLMPPNSINYSSDIYLEFIISEDNYIASERYYQEDVIFIPIEVFNNYKWDGLKLIILLDSAI